MQHEVRRKANSPHRRYSAKRKEKNLFHHVAPKIGAEHNSKSPLLSPTKQYTL
jgi:hypothetical protein